MFEFNLSQHLISKGHHVQAGLTVGQVVCLCLCVQSPVFEFSLGQHLVSKSTMYDMIIDPTQKFVATACQDRNIRSVFISFSSQGFFCFNKKSHKTRDMHRKFWLAPSPLCPCGAVSTCPAEQSAHVLQDCPNHQRLRQDFWPEATTMQSKLYVTISDLRTASFIITTGLPV